MVLVFWFGVVPLIGLAVAVVTSVKLAGLDKPLESLPAWQRELRLGLFPKIDATPEQRAEMERYEAARAAHARNEALISAIYNASATGRG